MMLIHAMVNKGEGITVEQKVKKMKKFHRLLGLLRIIRVQIKTWDDFILGT